MGFPVFQATAGLPHVHFDLISKIVIVMYLQDPLIKIVRGISSEMQGVYVSHLAHTTCSVFSAVNLAALATAIIGPKRNRPNLARALPLASSFN